MNHKSKLLGIALPIIIIFLASCEGNTTRDWRVDNQSSTTIYVESCLTGTVDTTVRVIDPEVMKTITITSEDKGNSIPQEAYEVFTHFLIFNASDTIEKNFTKNENWDIYIEHTKSNPDHFEMIYTVEVKNSDF